MGRYTGKDLYIQWAYSGGTIVLNTDYRSLTTSEETDTEDASAGADTHKSYKPTLADTTIELELLDNTSNSSAFWGALTPQTEGTLTWGPHGTATGKPKYSVPALVNSREREFPYDGMVTITVEFQAQSWISEATW
jgi:hypothetical protein